MIQKKITAYVKAHFGMDLFPFMRQKVEVESLYDYEIARILNVSTTSIRKLRNMYGIKRANGFSRRFENIYGSGAVEQFKKMIEDPNTSLTDVGRHFQFSREYSRQVFQKLYGYPYTDIYKRKQAIKRKMRLSSGNGESKLKGKYRKIRKTIEAMGLLADVKESENFSLTLTNGYKLAIRATSTPVLIGNNQYYRINNAKCSIQNFDFFVCLCKFSKEDIHFIIPSDIMPKSVLTLLPQAGPDQSKYAPFKEAWNLLHGEPPREMYQAH